MRAVNLIPAEQRSGASVGAGRSGGAAYAVLALVAGLAVMAALYGSAHHQISSRKAEAATLTARAQAAQSAAARLSPFTSFIALRQERTAAVEQLANSRFDWAHVFHEFGRVIPVNASITSLTGTVGSTNPAAAPRAPVAPSAPAAASPSSSASPPAAGSPPAASAVTPPAGAAVASSTPPGSVPTFAVSGCAISQYVVAETLTRLRLMDGVSNVTLLSSTKSAAGGSTTAAGGGCGANQPSFSATVTFQPLPVPSATPATSTVAVTPGGGLK